MCCSKRSKHTRTKQCQYLNFLILSFEIHISKFRLFLWYSRLQESFDDNLLLTIRKINHLSNNWYHSEIRTQIALYWDIYIYIYSITDNKTVILQFIARISNWQTHGQFSSNVCSIFRSCICIWVAWVITSAPPIRAVQQQCFFLSLRTNVDGTTLSYHAQPYTQESFLSSWRIDHEPTALVQIYFNSHFEILV